MSTKLNPCACGCGAFIKHSRITGIWVSILRIKQDGEIDEEGITDEIRYEKEPKTIRCDKCRKRHPNPDYQP